MALISQLRPIIRFGQLSFGSSVRYGHIQAGSPYEEMKVNLDKSYTKENPMKISAYGDERTIACVCGDMHFMTLKKGPPVKCGCGHWFQLVDAKKFWIKE